MTKLQQWSFIIGDIEIILKGRKGFIKLRVGHKVAGGDSLLLCFLTLLCKYLFSLLSVCPCLCNIVTNKLLFFVLCASFFPLPPS